MEQIDARSPIYGIWPRSESRTLDQNIGYLRIPQMNSDAVREIEKWMFRWRDTEGIIIDVRDNGGGSREALLAIAQYFD